MRISNNTDQKYNKPSFSATIFKINCAEIPQKELRLLTSDILSLTNKYKSPSVMPMQVTGDYYFACKDELDAPAKSLLTEFTNRLNLILESKPINYYTEKYKNYGMTEIKKAYDSFE